ncbi:MAG TPA: ubiquitin-like domain-containing protein [Candidatus Saccharimonadales bacterium]
MKLKSTKPKFKFNRWRRRHVRRIKLLSKHPFAVPAITFLILLASTMLAYHFLSHTKQLTVTPNSKIVIVSHDGVKQVVPTNDKTVGTLLSKLDITLNQGDVVEPSLTTPINQDDFRVNIFRAIPVEVVDGNNQIFTQSAATTPRAIAQQAGVNVYPEDNVAIVPTDNFIKAQAIGQQVVINRATPVTLNLYGTPLALRTHAKTVADLINDEKISVAPTDQIMPSLSTPLINNTQVFIIRKGTKIESITQTIAMPIQTISDPSLAYGTSAVRQQGSSGTEVITYQEQLNNGIAVSQTKIQDVVTQQPVTEIVVIGTSLSGIKGDMALAGIAPSDYQYADYIISHESGWCPTKAQGEHSCPAIPDNQFTSFGYGLCQATPGSKMSSAGADWATNPITQLRWCSGYANGRYGSWGNAYAHWVAYGNW